jgi:hypothetical protein
MVTPRDATVCERALLCDGIAVDMGPNQPRRCWRPAPLHRRGRESGCMLLRECCVARSTSASQHSRQQQHSSSAPDQRISPPDSSIFIHVSTIRMNGCIPRRGNGLFQLGFIFSDPRMFCPRGNGLPNDDSGLLAHPALPSAGVYRARRQPRPSALAAQGRTHAVWSAGGRGVPCWERPARRYSAGRCEVG